MARILIADDDEATLQLLQTAVREWHHETTLVREDAVIGPTVRAFKPDLMLLDYQFPSASGGQILSRVRTMPESEKLPVIIISGTPVELIKFNIEDSPLVRLLPKPVNLDKLHNVIQELLALGPSADGGSSGFEILK